MATAESLDFRPDLAFLTVKTQDVLATVQAKLAWLMDVPLVTFQNGLRDNELAVTFLPRRQIMSVSVAVNLQANYLTPGAVTILYPGPLVIGRPFMPNDAQVKEVAALLHQAVATTVSNNIYGAHWLKLIVNLNNAFPALTNTTFHQVYADPYLRQLAVQVMREGLRVAKQAGIWLESLPDTSATLVRLMGWLPVHWAAIMATAKLRRMESAWPLMGSTL